MPHDASRGPASPRIIAHRGASGDHPENTLAAFDAALAAGADGLEFDVQCSSDGVLVVYHDRTLGKIGGGRQRIHERTWSQLRSLDAGGWFQRRFAGQQIPSLSAVLDRYGGRTSLMLEIKLDGERSATRRRKLVDACVDELVSRALARDVWVLSFDREALRRVRHRAPELRCVLDVDAAPVIAPGWSRPYRGIDALCMPARCMRKSMRAALAEHGFEAWVYRCDTERHLAQAAAWSLEAVITDWPAWARSKRRENARV